MKRGFNLKLLTPNKKVFLTYIYDMIFYTLFIVGFLIFGRIVKIKSRILKQIDYNSIITNNPIQAKETLSLLQGFLSWLIGGLVVLGIFTLIIFTIFKGLIWAKLKNEKLDLRFLKKFFILNLIFSIPFILIALYIIIDIKNLIWLIPIILIFIHFHFLSVYFLIKDKKIWKSLKSSFKIGIIKLKYFFKPYLIITILFIILDIFFRFIPQSVFKAIFNFLVLIFYFALIRNYLYLILENEIKKNKKEKTD